MSLGLKPEVTSALDLNTDTVTAALLPRVTQRRVYLVERLQREEIKFSFTIFEM